LVFGVQIHIGTFPKNFGGKSSSCWVATPAKDGVLDTQVARAPEAYPTGQQTPISRPDAEFGTETGTFRGAFPFCRYMVKGGRVERDRDQGGEFDLQLRNAPGPVHSEAGFPLLGDGSGSG
jgi:hypothetical protein